MWATLLFGAAGTLCVIQTLSALWHLRWVNRLPGAEALGQAGSDDPGSAGLPRCSIVIAARNEEARIETTLRRLWALRGVAADVIVVEDRSTDRTREVLQRLAQENRNLQLKFVELLPEGWLGKCHACHLGASAATGEWILFTDADCWFRPDVVARAIRLADLQSADHVTLTPGIMVDNRNVRAWHLLFLISLLNWISGVNRDRSRSHLGMGAFNLVRTAAYRQSRGYEALRLTVLDDVKLGLLLRQAGKRTRAFLGGDDVVCHWGGTLGSMVRVMEKNYFAAVGYRLWLAALGGLTCLAVLGVFVAGLVSGTVVGVAAGLTPFLSIVPAAILARRLGWSWSCAIGTPFMFPVMLYALVNSTWVTLRQGGVRWGDTLYSLSELRAGNVR